MTKKAKEKNANNMVDFHSRMDERITKFKKFKTKKINPILAKNFLNEQARA